MATAGPLSPIVFKLICDVDFDKASMVAWSAMPAPLSKEVCARSAAARTSGWEWLTALVRPGRIMGTKGRMSRASTTKAQMLPAVVAAFLTSSAPGSRRPREMTGTSMAREAASTEFTKVVSMSWSRHTTVFSAGLTIASLRFTMSFCVSGCVITLATSSRHLVAMATTPACVSDTHSCSLGNSSGMARPIWKGARGESCLMSSRPVSLMRELRSSSAANSVGKMSGRAWGSMRPVTVVRAP
mmetsp:Transcript_6004/g.10399  ORF Transcript_6004/g.10399 Transcript_6004/m.10399 type:complete len:242 (-) Transcript_6004:1176-1901(-)